MSSLHTANLCSLHHFSGIVLPVMNSSCESWVDILAFVGNPRERIQVFNERKALAVIYFVDTFHELENTIISELLEFFQALRNSEFCQKLICDFMMHFPQLFVWQITFTLILRYEPSQPQILLVSNPSISLWLTVYIFTDSVYDYVAEKFAFLFIENGGNWSIYVWFSQLHYCFNTGFMKY